MSTFLISTHCLHTFGTTQAFLMTTPPPSPQKSSPFRNAPDHTPSTSPHHTWPGLSHPRRPQPPTTTPSGRERAVVGVGSGRMGQIYSAFPCCSLSTIGSTFVWGACGLPQALEIWVGSSMGRGAVHLGVQRGAIGVVARRVICPTHRDCTGTSTEPKNGLDHSTD